MYQTIQKNKDTDPIERELCLIALFKEKYKHACANTV
jgi:hypothetical protein